MINEAAAEQAWEETDFDSIELLKNFEKLIPGIPNACMFAQNSVSEQDIIARVELFSCELDDIPRTAEAQRNNEMKKLNFEKNIFHCSVYHLSAGFLEASHFSNFLAAFVVRHMYHSNHFLSIELIQRIMFLNLPGLYDLGKNQTSVVDKAACAYVLAAVGIGSLLENLFCSNVIERNYKLMKKSLKGCFGAEAEEVIFAHLVIAQFCRLAGRSHDFKKHSGFARVLINLSGITVSDRIKKTFFRVVLVPELAEVEGFLEVLTLDWICSSSTSLTQNDFALKFPCLHAYHLWKKQEFFCSNNIQQVTQKEKDLFKKYPKSEAVVGALLLTLPTYIRAIVTSADLSNWDKANALDEILNFSEFILVSFGHFPYNMEGTSKTMVCLSHVLYSFFSGDFASAKSLLKLVIKEMEFYMLVHWLQFDQPRHLFHVMIVVLSYLEMHTDYHVFKEKLNPMLELMGQPQINAFLPPIGHTSLRLICENCFSSTWVSLPMNKIRK